MDYKEALNVLGASKADSFDDITKKYRGKLKVAHPDQGGNSQWFMDVRQAFKVIMEQFKYKHHEDDEEEKNLSKELQEKLTEVLEKIDHAEMEITVLGSWIWLSGNTYDIRQDIKDLAFKFSRNKTAWYWYHGEYKKRSNKKFSLKDIATMHGKVAVEKKRKSLITTGGR